ncbi:MAG: GntR family transcriptional regulator [Deltaproteobacteria bacterium]|nr:GntR family transcriptional regulator [Deltaproteobacteria bacterium]MBT4269074.1 GntR family transcriptional regulator [Deltaproteobacteria bacterium]MBT4638116.1 GntR family transcriptional regulator [Deltaproteobacteria bacterium]MBT6500026.1 GntR family transcriptional regulator [Deltaproteobacteria bacterium]MBT6612551.1 GntR family transcriptional regulator [Deltaproteobacteria bacterium]
MEKSSIDQGYMSGKQSRKSIKQDIYRDIRKAIISGAKKPGERIIIDALTKAYQVSVTVVRDALQILSQERLVSIWPSFGYFVTSITFKELQDMFELREILETASVGLAAEKIRDSDIAVLESIHDSYTGDDIDSYNRYADENRMFHTRIADASGNAELGLILTQLLDRLAPFMDIRRAGKEMPGIHAQLIEKLKVHDIPGAKRTIQKELRETRDKVMQRIMREESGTWKLSKEE